MMVGVAIVAVGCAALPFLFIAPIPSLTAAALFAAIPVILTRGRNPRPVWPIPHDGLHAD